MNSVYFGVAGGIEVEGRLNPDGYDSGVNPSCSLNARNQFVEVHTNNGLSNDLWYWCGSVTGSELVLSSHGPLNFPGRAHPDGGCNPSVSLNDSGSVVEMHDSGHNRLWWWLGQMEGSSITWTGHPSEALDTGCDPAVAVNNNGVVVEIHNSGHDTLWWWVGHVSGQSITWDGHGPVNWPGSNPHDADSGRTPAVAINDDGLVLEVHDSSHGTLWYWIGQIEGGSITWIGHDQYDLGKTPSIALHDDDTIVEVHQTQTGGTLYQRIGQVTGSTLAWSDPFASDPPCLSYPYDYGINPSVGFNGSAAVQVHPSQDPFSSRMYATASLCFDRANWMSDNLTTLGSTQLKDLVMAASHDSGMYLDVTGAVVPPVDWSVLGKTQAFTILSQLYYGVRYLDLRPRWDGNQFIISHTVDGPLLANVLDQIGAFFQSGAKELVLVKLSHYGGFAGQHTFQALCTQVYGALKDWMYNGATTDGRLGSTTLSTFLNSGKPLLVVCDDCVHASTSPVPACRYTLPTTTPGLWVYRDWNSSDPQNGDLTVFDVYSDVDPVTDPADFLKDMISGTGPDPNIPSLPQGQLPKFQGFTGYCQEPYDGNPVPCDLFLLSWTVTPPTAIHPFSRLCNKVLGGTLAPVGANPAGRVMNLLYLDYLGDGRNSDIALVRNDYVAAEPKNGR